MHYVIYYTPEGGTEQSIGTGSNLTHYNLTGLERNRVYTNISVQAVNSAGKSERRVVSSNDVSPSATLQSSGYNVSPSSSSLTENDLLRSQQIDSSTSAGLEQPVMSTAEQGTSAETGPEVSTPVYSVTVENSEKISNSLLGTGSEPSPTHIHTYTYTYRHRDTHTDLIDIALVKANVKEV